MFLSKAKTRDDGWICSGSHCHFFSAQVQGDLSTVKAYCDAKGGKLAELETREESERVKFLLKSQVAVTAIGGKFFIGETIKPPNVFRIFFQ